MGYRRGWKICFAGVLIPCVVSLVAYASGFIYSILISPTSNWAFLPFIPFDFTYADLLSQNKDLAAAFLGNVEAAWSNVHSAAILAMCVIYFGLRQGQRWAWFVLLYLLIWSGISDSIAAMNLYKLTGKIVPMPMIAKAILIVGLWLSRDILTENPSEGNKH